MNAEAGPSRPRTRVPLHVNIDVNDYMIDQPRYSSPLSTTSTAPSFRIHRSSTQSAFSTDTWGGLQTPRLSLSGFDVGLSVDEILSAGEIRRSDSGGMMDDGKTGSWWVDLDKTPRPLETMFKKTNLPSRLPSYKQLPDLTPPLRMPASTRFLAPAPALPDNSPTIPQTMLESRIPLLDLYIPPFSPSGPKFKYNKDLSTPETLALFPVPHTIDLTKMERSITHTGALAPRPPPIPPRKSSKRSRLQPKVKPHPINTDSATTITQVPPPPPPPRASSLRSISSRASSSSSIASQVEVSAIQQKPESPSGSPLRRQPRVRSRSAKQTSTFTPRSRQPSHVSLVSLSSIVEDDEKLPDMEATPNGSWSLRRRQLRLHRARSQPRMRKEDRSGFKCVAEVRAQCCD